MTNALTDHQTQVVGEFMAARNAERLHLVVAISGAHAYGFASPDSDVDLKAVHVAPTRALVGLVPPPAHADALVTVKGVELDYTSNELGGVLSGILAGNGNYAERILGGVSWSTHPWLAEAQDVLRRSVSRRLHRHYAGFSAGQFRGVDTAAERTAKKVLYVLRTALTGVHVLATGEVNPDLTALMDIYGFSQAAQLVGRKLAGEKTALPENEYAHWRTEMLRARELLDQTNASSSLPEEPANVDEVDTWLEGMRKRAWDV